MSGRTRPLGRRPGDPEQTQQAILVAARECFARSGFERATIRAIAERAEVDPALVMHHFASKQKLFVAAHRVPFDPETVVDALAGLDVDDRARALARFYFTAFAAENSVPLSLVRAAATNEQAARMMREFLTSTLLTAAPRLAPGPDAERRLILVATHLIGLMLGRQILELDALVETSIDELIELVAPAVRSYLTGHEE